MINQTTDYSIFKIHPLNREINPKHVDKIVESMKRKLTFTFLKVDNDMQIIDGQHRFEALKRLGLPINYVQDDFTTIDMINENTNQDNWKTINFIRHYAKAGNQNYINILELSKKYEIATSGLLGVMLNSNNHYSIGGGYKDLSLTKLIKNGDFEFDYYEVDNKLLLIKNIINCFKLSKVKNIFVLAINNVINHSNCDYKTLLSKCTQHNYFYENKATTEQFIELLEEIYNYKNREKVSFKY